MKKLGLIGGLGPEASIEYYRLIIKQYQERLNTNNYPEIFLISTNMTEMLACIYSNRLDDLVDLLSVSVRILERSGADFGAIGASAPHIVFDRLAQRINFPMISLVEETCKAIRDKGVKCVGLIGTKITMQGKFFHITAAKYGIQVVTPTVSGQDYIDSKYMSELVFNDIVPETKNTFIRIIKELKEMDSIEGLILGGSELQILLNQTDFKDILVFDTTKIHVNAILDEMVGEKTKKLSPEERD